MYAEFAQLEHDGFDYRIPQYLTIISAYYQCIFLFFRPLKQHVTLKDFPVYTLIIVSILRSDRSLTTHLYIENESTNVLKDKIRILKSASM